MGFPFWVRGKCNTGEAPWNEVPQNHQAPFGWVLNRPFLQQNVLCSQYFCGESLRRCWPCFVRATLSLAATVCKLVDWKNAMCILFISLLLVSCHVLSSDSMPVFYIEDAFSAQSPFYRWRLIFGEVKYPG